MNCSLLEIVPGNLFLSRLFFSGAAPNQQRNMQKDRNSAFAQVGELNGVFSFFF
jgi:hypothetical protein